MGNAKLATCELKNKRFETKERNRHTKISREKCGEWYEQKQREKECVREREIERREQKNGRD